MIDRIKRNINEFKTFAIKGNVIDMAVGIIIGAAFGKVVDSLVKDMIMPPLGWLMGKVDFTNLYVVIPTSLDLEETFTKYPSLDAAQKAGAVTINYGLFINTLISFLIVAFAVFLLVKMINKVRATIETDCEKEEEATTKTCPRCFSTIDIKATKCPHCCADI